MLIIGAWNYPIALTLSPLVGAIAAGNCAVLKPSEVTPRAAQLLEEELPKFLDQSCYYVYNGGIPETTLLLGKLMLLSQSFFLLMLYFRAKIRLYFLHWQHHSWKNYLRSSCQILDAGNVRIRR